MLIILGDAGINYYLNNKDEELKNILELYKIKLFCIQGNHEERPENISSYHEVEMFGGKVYIEDNHPNLIFAKNGELYNIDEKSILVVGGAYSVDKDYRLRKGYQWFKDEQLNNKERDIILKKYKGKHIDIVLSHTCPLKYEPTEMFLKGIDQSKVDNTMEKFLDQLEESIEYNKWYCGHWHIEKKISKIEFMFGRIKKFNSDEFYPKYDNSTGYEILRDKCSLNDVFTKNGVFCPICNSEDIIIQKGNGELINGFDAIACICNKCKKVYGFSDVNYKSNCPREL
jgi:3-oxoacid CoA-transferase subunit A